MAKRRKSTKLVPMSEPGYGSLLAGISDLLDQARRMSARTVNNILTFTYWEIGRRIVQYEQGGKARAEYGEGTLVQLSQDLTGKHGRGFSKRNLEQMRAFYLGWEIAQTPSAQSRARAKIPPELRGGLEGSGQKFLQPASGKSNVSQSTELGTMLPPMVFPLSWSHYTRLLSVEKPRARAFYEAEAVRGGWSVRQLDRQISTQFFERSAHSKQREALLARGQKAKPEDAVSVRDEIRDPYLLRHTCNTPVLNGLPSSNRVATSRASSSAARVSDGSRILSTQSRAAA